MPRNDDYGCLKRIPLVTLSKRLVRLTCRITGQIKNPDIRAISSVVIRLRNDGPHSLAPCME